MLVFAITANFWQVVTFDMTLTHFSSILSVAVSYKLLIVSALRALLHLLITSMLLVVFLSFNIYGVSNHQIGNW